MTPGAYLRACRESQGLTLEDLALRTDTAPAACVRVRMSWLAAIEADAAPISVRTGIALYLTLRFDPAVLDELIARQEQHVRRPLFAGPIEFEVLPAGSKAS